MGHWKSLFALLAVILWIGAASAQSTVNLNLPTGKHSLGLVAIEAAGQSEMSSRKYSQDRCYGTANLFFGHSAHPGGDLNGRLNQNNGGHGGRCYLDFEKSLYGIALGLQNSQYGNTLVFGVGKRWTIIDLETRWLNSLSVPIKRVRLFVGAETGSIYYEKRLGRGAIFSPFVFPNVAASIHIGEFEVSAMQIYLPQGIKLWGHSVEVPNDVFGGYQPYQSHLANTSHPHVRPTLFINYRF
jgi:hypothetical protein